MFADLKRRLLKWLDWHLAELYDKRLAANLKDRQATTIEVADEFVNACNDWTPMSVRFTKSGAGRTFMEVKSLDVLTPSEYAAKFADVVAKKMAKR